MWRTPPGLPRITVILGTERVTDRGLQITACVINPDGRSRGGRTRDRSTRRKRSPIPRSATERRVFTAGPLTFGIAICHEGWRYPETVRWAVRRGAQVVFHPHAHVAEPGSYRPTTFADPANTFHEKAMLCRAAENTCYFASVNCASEGSGTTSAIARPDGTLLVLSAVRPGGLLVADWISPGDGAARLALPDVLTSLSGSRLRLQAGSSLDTQVESWDAWRAITRMASGMRQARLACRR